MMMSHLYSLGSEAQVSRIAALYSTLAAVVSTPTNSRILCLRLPLAAFLALAMLFICSLSTHALHLNAYAA